MKIHRAYFGLFLSLCICTALVVSVGLYGEAHAADFKKGGLYGKDRDLGKVSSHLLEARQLFREGRSAVQVQEAVPVLRLKDSLVEIEVRLKTLTPETVARIEAIGMQVTGVYYEYARVG